MDLYLTHPIDLSTTLQAWLDGVCDLKSQYLTAGQLLQEKMQAARLLGKNKLANRLAGRNKGM